MGQHHRLGAADHHLDLGSEVSPLLGDQRKLLADGGDEESDAVVRNNSPQLWQHARVRNRRNEVSDDMRIRHRLHIDSHHEQPFGHQLRYQRAAGGAANPGEQHTMLDHVPMVQSSIRTGS